MTEKCSCPHEGYCERHKMNKTGKLYEICQRDDDVGERFRRAWDRQTGYGQESKTTAATQTMPEPEKKVNAPVTVQRTGGCGCGAKIKPALPQGANPTTAMVVDADGVPTGQKVEVMQAEPATQEATLSIPSETSASAPSAQQVIPPSKLTPGISIKGTTQKLILWNKLSPGDILVMTAVIESLHRQYPDRYSTDIECPVPAIYDHNPRITKLDPQDTEVQKIEMHYPLINMSNQLPVHFIQGYVDYLGDKLKIPLKLQVNRPYIYLSEDERQWISQVQEITGKPMKYWIINAGTKQDYTAKRWGRDQYQEVVKLMKGRVNFVQIGERHHLHKPLEGVLDLTGKTDARQLIRLCWHAQGGVGPITFIQHIFAAFEKPYVALLGGREPFHWEHYPSQTTLSTIGMLSCCSTGGCWKSRVVPQGDGDDKDKSLCEFPTYGYEEPIPRCMAMIRPQDVVDAIDKYYVGGRVRY